MTAIRDVEETFTDRVSGASRAKRTALVTMLWHSRRGDTVRAASMDRLASSVVDLTQIVTELTSRGVAVGFVAEHLSFEPRGGDPFTTVQLHLLGAIAQRERSLIRERQREGTASARQRRTCRGRVRGLDHAAVAEVMTIYLWSGRPEPHLLRPYLVHSYLVHLISLMADPTQERTVSPDLFQSFDLCGLTLPNRVVMAPMTRSRALTGAPDELTVRYYEQRAGAGLIISEGSPITQEGNGWLNTPGLYTDAQVAGWRRVSDAVHARGGRMFAQLWHVGRGSHTSLQVEGRAPVSSTTKDGDTAFALRPDGTPGFVPISPPRALATGEVARVVEDFAAAAGNADAAGFDGVEIHAATRYLFEQFLNAAFNDRTDRYGARTLADRIRFLLETVDAVCDRVGESRVGVRVSPFSLVGNMPVDDQAAHTYHALVRELADRRLAYVHVHDTSPLETLPEDGRSIRGTRIQDFLRSVRPDLAGTAMVLAGGLTRRSATRLLHDDVIDLAGFGRPFVANPDLVDRFRDDTGLTEADTSTFYVGGARGYTDYPPVR